MNYNISNEAALDLEEIWLYTFEHWSIEQADKYYNQLLNEIEYISKNPKSGKDFSNFRKGFSCKSKFTLNFLSDKSI